MSTRRPVRTTFRRSLPVIPDPRTDAELVTAYRSGERSAADVLLGRHQGLVIRAAARVRIPKWMDRDDLQQSGFIAILKCAAASGWNPARVNREGKTSKFSTYAFTAVLNAILREVARQGDVDETGNPELHEDQLPAAEKPEAAPVGTLPRGLSHLAASIAEMILAAGDDERSIGRAAAAHGMSIPQVKALLAAELGVEWKHPGSRPRPTGPEVDGMVTIREAMEEFGLTHSQVVKRLDKGELPHQLIGGLRMIPRAALDAFRPLAA